MYPVSQPMPVFSDLSGSPLESGYVYIGSPGLNPETNPIQVYWDYAGTQPAAQPLRTLGGVIVRNGTPANIFCNTDYSVSVKDVKKQLVYYSASSAGLSPITTLTTSLASSSGSSMIGFLQSGLNAVLRTVQSKLRDSISVFDFMTTAQIADVQANTALLDVTTAVQAAITAAAGRPVYFPAGTYVISSTLSYNAAATFGFTSPGLKIIGEGMNKTFFDNRVANNPMIDIDSGSHGGSYQASMGAVLSEFAIINTTSPANSVGIRVLNGYEVLMHHLYIKGMTSHGIELKNGLYTDDGWNMVSITNTWIDSCKGWGIKADGTSGRNEGSYTYLREVFFQSNGTADALYQPGSGGMIWKGQVLVMESSGFANGNQNCGLFIKGDTGLGQVVDLRNVTFENCIKRGLFCRGISAFKARNLQFFNNNTYVATNALEFEAASYTVRQVDIDGVVVRATSGNNPYTAFKISGANADLTSCRVKNVTWDNFDYTGQTRFDGWQFDNIQNCGVIIASASTDVALRPNQYAAFGNKVPLRLRGGAGGVPSTSGEWVAYQLPTTGITVPLAGVLAGTRYWCYLYDNNGLPTIEVTNAASPVIDSATGYYVKSGDATKFYVGSILGGASNATVAVSGTGWLSPAIVAGSQNGAFSYLWTDSSNRLRVKYAALPANDTDGTIVGTQT